VWVAYVVFVIKLKFISTIGAAVFNRCHYANFYHAITNGMAKIKQNPYGVQTDIFKTRLSNVLLPKNIVSIEIPKTYYNI